MNPFRQRPLVPRKLDRLSLREASTCIMAKWLNQFIRGTRHMTGGTEFAEFGAFEPNLAEAIVLDQGADFVFSRWGAALGTLCGGDHRGHRLSALPQPSRGQLRRVCVRAAAAQMPKASHATWAVDGQIWQCAMMALPTAGNELSATRLILALLFEPHPMFTASFKYDGEKRPGPAGTLAARTIIPNEP